VQSACRCGLRAKILLAAFTIVCYRVCAAPGEKVSVRSGPFSQPMVGRAQHFCRPTVRWEK
jgi:hypothetical protein